MGEKCMLPNVGFMVTIINQTMWLEDLSGLIWDIITASLSLEERGTGLREDISMLLSNLSPPLPLVDVCEVDLCSFKMLMLDVGLEDRMGTLHVYI